MGIRTGLRQSVVAVVALVLGVVALGSVSASASTLEFQVEIDDHSTKVPGCSNGAFICGDPTISGFGPAEFSYFLTSVTPVPDLCDGYVGGAYTATTTFTLPDASRLTLEETGFVCGPGNSLIAPGGLHSYGNPVDGSGTWEVSAATGRFAGLTGGGTNTFRSAGARIVATYVGTLEG